MIARFLGNLLSIKPNEWDGVLYFFLVLLLFSFGASFARSIGMALLVKNLGGDSLPIIFILIDLSVMVGSVVYAHYTKKVSGLSILGFFFVATTIFSGFVQLLFIFNGRAENLNWVYGFFFVGFFFFYILIFIHTGSVIASYFTAVQVKRVTSVINTGIPIGGALGGSVLVLLLNVFNIDPQRLTLVLAVSCLSALWVLRIISFRLHPVRAGHAELRSNRGPIYELITAFKYIINSRLMVFMSIGLMLFVIGSKLLEYHYQAIIYPQIYSNVTERASFFAIYEIFANIAWLLVQLFLTSRIIVSMGVGASNLLHPILSSIAALALFIYFFSDSTHPKNDLYLMLGLAIFTQFVNQEMRGALRTPANNLLFNAISPNQWGTTKAFLNGIIFPLATTIAGTILIFITDNQSPFIQHISSFTKGQINYILPLIALATSLLGIIVALPQWAAYNEGVFGLLNRELFNRHTDINAGKGGSNTLKRVIEEKLGSADHYHVVAALEMIRVLRLNFFVNHVGNLLLKSDSLPVQEHCINTLASLPLSNTNVTYLVEALRIKQDSKIIPLILKNLSQFKTVNLNREVEKLLAHPVPAVFIEACLYLHAHPLYKPKQAIERKIIDRLNDHKSPNIPLYLTALGELHQPSYSDVVLPFLESDKSQVRVAAFTAYIRTLEGQLEPRRARFIEALSAPEKEIKVAALQALKECQPLSDWSPIIKLLGAKDRAIVNESKELLRLNLTVCKPDLVDHVFSSKSTVQERFETLSLIYGKFIEEQYVRLQVMAEESLQKFLEINALLKLHQATPITSRTHDLIAKILQEVAENHLLNVLTVITYSSEQNLEFFQRVSRGLLSNSRANQGNALEVLSNAGEKYLSTRVLKYFEERVNDVQAVNRIYKIIFNKPLDIDARNYEKLLLELNHDLLRACLHYVQKERTGRLKLGQANKKVREFLIETTTHHSKPVYS